MYKICPICGKIAEYNAYYSRYTCTSCVWESEKIIKTFTFKSSSGNKKIIGVEQKVLLTSK